MRKDQEADARDVSERSLHHSVDVIDAKFGKGYAREHPELVAGYMLVEQQGFIGELIVDQLSNIGSRIGDAIDRLGNDYVWQGLHEIAHAFGCGTEVSVSGLDDVADAIDPEGKRHERMAQFHKAKEAEEEQRRVRDKNGGTT